MDDKTKPDLQREDFKHALEDIGSFVDVNLDDLMEINAMAQRHARLREAEATRIRDIMTADVATVTPDTTLRDAARILLELRISGLPVVNAQGVVQGVVTEADFLCAMGVPCHHPAHNLWQTLEAMFNHAPRGVSNGDRVEDIMSKQVVTITAEQTLHEAIASMKKHHIKRLIVVDDEQHVVGVVTRSNLVEIFLKRLT
jgi:CBS-domain-containing membrane protein